RKPEAHLGRALPGEDLPMKIGTKLALLLVAATLGAACKENGRSVVRVMVTADSTLTALQAVDIQVTKGASVLRTVPQAWTGAPIDVGIYLPKEVSGRVDVVANGYGAADSPLAVTQMAMSADVVPGAVSSTV